MTTANRDQRQVPGCPILPDLNRSDPIRIGILSLQGAFQEHFNHLHQVVKGLMRSDVSIEIRLVRTSEELVLCSGLIIPGGESTTISLIASNQSDLRPISPNQTTFSLYDWLKVFIRSQQRAVWGTCAGMILCSDEVVSFKPTRTTTPTTGNESSQFGAGTRTIVEKSCGGIPLRTVRNQYGGQLNSFEKPVKVPFLSNPDKPFPLVFIRAPRIHSLLLHNHNQDSLESFNPLLRLPTDLNLPKLDKSQEDGLGPDHDLICCGYPSRKILVTSFHPELTPDTRFHQFWLNEFVLKP